MNKDLKHLVKSYVAEYLMYHFPQLQIKSTKLFECPFKHNHSIQNNKPSCKIYPQFGYKVTCFNCGELGTIFDIFKKVEPDMKTLSEDEIADYIMHLLDIKTNEEVDKLLELYSNSGFYLIPLQPKSKDPIQGESWKKNITNDIRKWREWVDAGLGLGLICGKQSNVMVIDIDTKEIPEEIQPLLNGTSVAETRKGWHYIYSYDEDFDFINHQNLRRKGYEIDFRANNSYVVVAPSIVDDYVRTWNGKKISKMPDKLKKFLLELLKKDKKEEINSDDEIQKAIENDEINLQGSIPEGQRDTELTKIGGVFRKQMNSSNVLSVLMFINKNFCKPPLTYAQVKKIVDSLNRYDTYDKKDLAKEILEHLKMESVRFANTVEISKSLGYTKKEIEDALDYLLKEQKVQKIGKQFKALNKLEWDTNFMGLSKPLDFEVPYFDKYARFENGSMIIIGAKTGQGKCFGKGTKILMYDGSYKNVENIQIGDKVMGTDSNYRTIKNIHSGIDDLYEIIPNKSKSFIVNSEHILSLYVSNLKQVKNISVKDYLKSNKTFKNYAKIYRLPVDFNEQSVPIEPYFLGLWLGDGDNRDARICKNDKEVVDYLQNYADRLKGKLKKYSIRSNEQCAYKISFQRKGGWQNHFSIQKTLRNLNVLQNKHIPNIYKINSRENRLQLLAGLLDTDGYMSCGNFEIITKYSQLADDIQYLAGSLGFLVNKRIKKVKYNNELRSYWRLSIIGDCSIIPTKIKRKQAPKRKINKNPLVTSFEIKKLSKDKYFGFEIDGNHLHFIENFIVQHNSHLSMNFIKEFVDRGITPYYVCTEAGSKFSLIGASLGLKEGDYKFKIVPDATSVEFEDNSVIVCDWVRPQDYAKTDLMMENLNNQLIKHGGLLIAMVQLRKDGSFFAPDLFDFFANVVATYNWTERKNEKTNQTIIDNENTYFKTTKIRDSKNDLQYVTIPTFFNKQTKRIILRSGE